MQLRVDSNPHTHTHCWCTRVKMKHYECKSHNHWMKCFSYILKIGSEVKRLGCDNRKTRSIQKHKCTAQVGRYFFLFFLLIVTIATFPASMSQLKAEAGCWWWTPAHNIHRNVTHTCCRSLSLVFCIKKNVSWVSWVLYLPVSFCALIILGNRLMWLLMNLNKCHNNRIADELDSKC